MAKVYLQNPELFRISPKRLSATIPEGEKT